MLRWSLSNVRILGGYGRISSTIRPSSSAVAYRRIHDKNDSSSHAANASNHDASRDMKRVTGGYPTAQLTTRSFRHEGYCHPSAAGEFYLHAAERPAALAIDRDESHSPENVSTDVIHGDANISTSPDRAAIEALKHFLSRSNRFSLKPQEHTANTVRSLYLSVKSRFQLHELDSARISALISLFGTLSIPHPQYPCIYNDPFVSHMKDRSFRTYWPFVLQIASDKKRLGQRFSHSDHYWSMRAHLAAVNNSNEGGSPNSDPSRRSLAMSKASLHYLRLSRYTADPEVHVSFLETLLSFRTAHRLREAVDAMCGLLRRLEMVHSRLLEVLWLIVLKPGADMSLTLQEQLLSAIWDRFTTPTLNAFGNSKPSSLNVATPSLDRALNALGIVQLASQLSALFSPSFPSSVSQHLVHRWSASQFAVAFSPDVATATRWNSLVLLALFNASPSLRADHGPPSLRTPTEQQSISSQLDIVLALANLEKSLGGQGLVSETQPELRDSIRVVVRLLWHTWSGSSPVGSQARFVSRAVAVSFFRLSTITADAPLMNACRRYCISSDLWLADEFDELAKSQVRTMAVEYAVASAVCGSCWADIISALTHVWLGTEWREMVAHLAMKRLTSLDVDLAHQLLLHSDYHGIEIPSISIQQLVIALVSRGRVDLAIPILKNPRFSCEQLEELLVITLRFLARSQRTYFEPQSVTILGDTLQRLYSSSPPPSGHRRAIQYFLSTIALSRHPAQAMSIVQAVRNASPFYFEKYFYSHFLRALLRQRQFHRAVRLMDMAVQSYPRDMDELWSRLLQGLYQGGAHNLAYRAYQRHFRYGIRQSGLHSLMRTVDFRSHSPPRMLVHKLLQRFRRSKFDGPTVQFTVNVLARAGRILAAKKLFQQFQADLDPATRTAIGNMILHQNLLRTSTRNGKLLRRSLTTMNYLIKEQNFTPDRVTVNILLKAILRWRTVIDSEKLRVLFDHLVRSGYPGGDDIRSGRTPFGSLVSSSPRLHLPRLPPFTSFERHVRPLYKMFIKAFQLRGDVLAAKMVIGLLKGEETVTWVRRERQCRSRIKMRLRTFRGRRFREPWQ